LKRATRWVRREARWEFVESRRRRRKRRRHRDRQVTCRTARVATCR